MLALGSILATQITEVRKEELSDGGTRQNCDEFLVDSTSEVPYSSDATCVVLKDVPLGLRKWSAE